MLRLLFQGSIFFIISFIVEISILCQKCDQCLKDHKSQDHFSEFQNSSIVDVVTH